MQLWADPSPAHRRTAAPDPTDRDAATRSDLACIIDHAMRECDLLGGSLLDRLGLMPAQFADLTQTWFPALDFPEMEEPVRERLADQEAIALLLLWRGGHASPESHWFAAIIARRAMETRHLWEDLGLPSRQALNDLMARHFPGLHAANSQRMRWKKFFYRQICSDSDFALCLSPTCDDCEEKAECFAPDEPHDGRVPPV